MKHSEYWASSLLVAIGAACGSPSRQTETVPAHILDPDRYQDTTPKTRVEYKQSDKATTSLFPPPETSYTTDSGLRFVVFERGTATKHPRSTSTVTVHYDGYTIDGNLFDSSVQRGEPMSLVLNDVIPGWREGVKLMTVGDSFRFWVPEKDAYQGAEGKPKGLLIFDVQLIAYEPQ